MLYQPVLAYTSNGNLLFETGYHSFGWPEVYHAYYGGLNVAEIYPPLPFFFGSFLFFGAGD